MSQDIMTRKHAVAYAYDFECVLESFDGYEFVARLDNGDWKKLDLWVGEAVDYKKPESQKNLVGKRILVTDAWLASGNCWITNTKIKVLA